MQVTKQHNEDCRKLLGLMGVPVVEVFLHDAIMFCLLMIVHYMHRQQSYDFLLWYWQAPSEAEAQCAALCKSEKVCNVVIL